MSVRLLGPEDASAFQALRLRGLCECPTAFASSCEEESKTSLAVVAERLTASPSRAMFGAFNAKSLAGVVGVQREEMRKLRHKAFLWGMYVAPELRNKGAGRLLARFRTNCTWCALTNKPRTLPSRSDHAGSRY